MSEDQYHLPLYEALSQYASRSSVRLHMPGHKGGAGFPEPLRTDWLSFTSLDVTEIADSDDLYNPQGPLQLSQNLLRDLYQAKQSFYLINGASVGLMAALWAMASGSQTKKRRVLLPHHAHRSLWHGCIIADLWPERLPASFDSNTGLPLPSSLAELNDCLENYDDLCGVVLLNPNYYGLGIDLDEQIDLIHQFDLPVCVDEAHGTHLRFLPHRKDALMSGADIVVQSPHKTAISLTQTAWMHVNQDDLKGKVFDALKLLHSSSPSFPLMVSLEMARQQLALKGVSDWERVVTERKALVSNLQNIPGLSIIDATSCGLLTAYQDPAKLFVNVNELGLTGYQAAEELRKLGISSEMADGQGVLWFLTPSDVEHDYERIFKACQILSATKRKEKTIGSMTKIINYPTTTRLISPREAWLKETQEVELTQAIGRISATMLTPYPPGVPLLSPGELLTEEIINYLRELIDEGANVTGFSSGSTSIKVVSN